MHPLARRLQELPEKQRQEVLAQMIAANSDVTTRADKHTFVSMADFTEDAQEYYKNYGKFQGTSTGYPSLDRLTKGLVSGELVVIAGKTSYGKTTLAINIANKVALMGGRVLFVTLEMTHAQITSRFMYINGGVGEDYSAVSTNVVYQAQDELSWTDIDGLIANAVNQMHVNLVVIDHLHYFSREIENTAEDLGRITKEFKKNAGRHGIPIILISHVRKTGKGEHATMDDLRGSSYIAQDADIVLMVGRNVDDETELIVKIEKNRSRGYDYASNVASLLFDNTIIRER